MTSIKPHRLTPETGAMLRDARKQKRWTLEKAAQEVGVHLSHLSRMETGRSAPSTALAMDLVFVFQLDHDQARRLISEAVPGVGRDKASRRKAKAAA
jgi:transcriptional regulator with XRE-family HTH domain